MTKGIALAAAVLAAAAPTTARAAAAPDRDDEPGGPQVYVVVLDFAARDANVGQRLADSLRLGLRRQEGYFVLDRLTTQELSRPLGLDTPAEKVAELARNRAGCNVALYGDVTRDGRRVALRLRCVDLTDPNEPGGWTQTFHDDTERYRAVIKRAAIERLTGREAWTPPQYGDEAEPNAFGRPLNANGDFEHGRTGWDHPDNVSTFLVKGPKGRGTILRVRTDLARGPWLAYRRKLRLGRADPKRPPKIPRDTGYSSVAGLEGVHFRSDWIRAEPGWRYWLLVDAKKAGGTPKVFVKGFIDWSKKADGLPERSLAERKLTPEQFAKLPETARRALIRDDARRHPERYRRESYRWYLNLRGPNDWHHYAAPFPPRGGLPDNVLWLQIQIYSYWPPGEYLWDDCWLYKDPRLAGPVDEEPARTKRFERSREQTRPD
jgi:TolB-like protein